MSVPILACFEGLEDPRHHNVLHKLDDILFIACCAVICGAESWDDVELYGKSKQPWLDAFLTLPHGIPSDDTFRRVFELIDPQAFEHAFRQWIQSFIQHLPGDIIPIDGKRLRGAFKTAKGNVIHEVSAWSCQHQLVLGQVKTAAKSNEITAIPELLHLLDIAGAVITIDAMGTQKNIAACIVEKQADYVLALKGNHSTLHQDVTDYFDYLDKQAGTEAPLTDSYEDIDKGHGRLEIRCCQLVQNIDWLEGHEHWTGLRSLVKIQTTTEYLIDGRRTDDTRYYIASLACSAAEMLQIIRAHWQIENKLHWVLDVSFNEDASHIRLPHAAENFSLLRKIAMTMLKQDKARGSLKGKRKRAGWDNDFLLSLFSFT